MSTPHTPDAARATILARLWGAAEREPLPAIRHRARHGNRLTITTHTGHTITGPAHLARPFAAPPADFTLSTPHQTVADAAHLATLITTPGPTTDQLTTHLHQSQHGLTLARTAATAHPPADRLWHTARHHHPDPTVYFEQIVTDGHPIHPLCRTRGDLTEHQTRQYAPEHHPRVPLTTTALPPHRHHLTGHWPWRDHNGHPLLPIHPHQADQHPPTNTRTPIDAAPLMSLRTLAPHHHPQLHIKTALHIQMTSAIRQVSPAAIHNGPHLTRLLNTLTAHTPLTVQPETATLTALTDDNRPDPHHAAILRTSPPALLPAAHTAIPLAALAARDPHTGTPLVHTVITTSRLTPTQWWEQATRALLPVPLRLAARHGIGLEAHGQNTLLITTDGTPHGTLYRDFGGVRIHTPTLEHSGHTTPPLAGDIDCDDPSTVHTKLIAALYTVAIAQLVDALTHAYPDTPTHTWWDTVATTTRPHVRNTTLHHALFDTTWPIKATTAMRLDPHPTTDIWTTTPNPIADLG